MKPRAAIGPLWARSSRTRGGQLDYLPGHAVTFSLEENLWHEMTELLRAAALGPLRLSAIAEPLMERLARMERLSRVSKVYFILPDVMAALAARGRACAEAHPEKILTLGQFREASSISRHATMPVFEFFDRVGFTPTSRMAAASGSSRRRFSGRADRQPGTPTSNQPPPERIATTPSLSSA